MTSSELLKTKAGVNNEKKGLGILHSNRTPEWEGKKSGSRVRQEQKTGGFELPLCFGRLNKGRGVDQEGAGGEWVYTRGRNNPS